jgi:hypothetical protein
VPVLVSPTHPLDKAVPAEVIAEDKSPFYGRYVALGLPSKNLRQ